MTRTPSEAALPGDSVRWDDGVGAWLVTSCEACKALFRQDDATFIHPDVNAEDFNVRIS